MDIFIFLRHLFHLPNLLSSALVLHSTCSSISSLPVFHLRCSLLRLFPSFLSFTHSHPFSFSFTLLGLHFASSHLFPASPVLIPSSFYFCLTILPTILCLLIHSNEHLSDNQHIFPRPLLKLRYQSLVLQLGIMGFQDTLLDFERRKITPE